MTAQDPPGRQSATDRLRSATRDLRSLGLGAPLRAGYEASKRFGGHTLIFRHLVPTSGDVSAGRSPFEWPAIPEEVRERTLAAADRIVGGTIEVFGRDLDFEDVPEWHAIIEAPGTWPVDDWWRIDIRSDDRPGDIKWAWELGRHRHLVILARAAHLEPSDHRYRTVLERHLESWIETNPPEIGVHWYSNLEIALRSIAWLQILSLAGEQLPASLRRAMWRHLHHAGRHLLADLPYTLSTMPNNHLLGDALGLIALGKAFGGKTGQRWLAIGDRIFNRQLARQVQSDGSMIEDSVSYHRFVLEMLSMRVVLGGAPPTVYDAMGRSAQFLARLGVLDGPVPQYGDWDEGRVFAVADDPARMEGSVLARPCTRRERRPRRLEADARRGGLVRCRRRAAATGGSRDPGKGHRGRHRTGTGWTVDGVAEGRLGSIPWPCRPFFGGHRRRRPVARRRSRHRDLQRTDRDTEQVPIVGRPQRRTSRRHRPTRTAPGVPMEAQRPWGTRRTDRDRRYGHHVVCPRCLCATRSAAHRGADCVGEHRGGRDS